MTSGLGGQRSLEVKDPLSSESLKVSYKVSYRGSPILKIQEYLQGYITFLVSRYKCHIHNFQMEKYSSDLKCNIPYTDKS